MRTTAILISLSVLSLLTFATAQSCQALVLQGGGDKGAYQAGVLWSLIYNGTSPNNVKYDVLTGISAGSINSIGVAMYQIGDEVNLANFLNTTWRTMGKDQVYNYWAGGLVEAVLFKSSLADNSPLRKTLTSIITLPLYRRINVGTTDANSGDYHTYSEADFGNNLTMAVDAVLFSSAIPVFFPFQSYEQYAYVDGGVSKGFDVTNAVERCLEIVTEQSQITIDVVLTYGDTFSDVAINNYSTIQMLMRYLALYGWKIFNMGLVNARLDYPDVNFRYIIGPSQTLPDNMTPMDFDPTNIDFMINLGVTDGLKAIQEGEGVSFDRYLENALEFYELHRQGNSV